MVCWMNACTVMTIILDVTLNDVFQRLSGRALHVDVSSELQNLHTFDASHLILLRVLSPNFLHSSNRNLGKKVKAHGMILSSSNMSTLVCMKHAMGRCRSAY